MADSKSTDLEARDQLQHLLEAVGRMEGEILHFKGYARILDHLSHSPHAIEAEVLTTISTSLEGAQARLEAIWDEATEVGQRLQKLLK